MEVPGGGEPALRHHEDARAEALDLVQHVAGHDHAASLAPESPEERNHVDALARVEAGQRLVEDEDGGIVDDRLRDLDALPHALRVGRQPARVGRVEIDDLERVRRRAVGLGKAVQRGCQPNELAGRQRLEDALLLGHEPDRVA